MKVIWTKKVEKQQPHAYKGYASSYNVDVLYSFNRELQLKYTKSPIKNKLIHAWAELRCSKFAARLVIEF